jgi:hypothetical protein
MIKTKTIIINVDYEVWKTLRQLSFDLDTTMTALIRDAINTLLTEKKK